MSNQLVNFFRQEIVVQNKTDTHGSLPHNSNNRCEDRQRNTHVIEFAFATYNSKDQHANFSPYLVLAEFIFWSPKPLSVFLQIFTFRPFYNFLQKT